ncbi:MAG: HAD-IC family P-type ATPase [Candidatus Nanopelagicales bacterium]
MAANLELGSKGLRVMAFAYRLFDPDMVEQVRADPMAAVSELTFSSLVGIIDPLRPTAKEAIAVAHKAGIDVRMITGDHAVTAQAIAADLGLGPGVITGPEFAKLTDAELLARLDDLHVFGRVAPEDKLRLVSVMQQAGQTVAMTGDAVNDAAALKKADVGVAMGSGSDVTKQAANMVLTDDNFATLVHAIELGRDIYGKITAQLRYVMTGLFGVLLVMLLASALDVNAGQALTPVMLIFVTFLVGIFPAIGDLHGLRRAGNHGQAAAGPERDDSEPQYDPPVAVVRTGAGHRHPGAVLRPRRAGSGRRPGSGTDHGIRGGGAQHGVDRGLRAPRPGPGLARPALPVLVVAPHPVDSHVAVRDLRRLHRCARHPDSRRRSVVARHRTVPPGTNRHRGGQGHPAGERAPLRTVSPNVAPTRQPGVARLFDRASLDLRL